MAPRNHGTEDTLDKNAETFKRQAELMKTAIRINNATKLTCLSCCLFAPVTLPYICYQENKKQRLLQGR